MSVELAPQATEALSVSNDGIVTVRLVWPDAPLTMNAARLLHHRSWSKRVKEWRDAFQQLAQGCPRLAWCDETIDHETATRRRVDIAACAPSEKAAIDGVVLAGVLEDDSAEFIRTKLFRPPTYTGRDALVITLEGPAA